MVDFFVEIISHDFETIQQYKSQKFNFKMKIALVFLCVAVFAINAFPVEIDEQLLAAESADNVGEHSRVKRFTCDVLSVEAKGVKVNHAACAAHCLVRGKTGGYCNGQRVCICR